MNPKKILQKYYGPNSELYKLLVIHGKKVGDKAVKLAKKFKHLNPDYKFIREAAMLHDIGIKEVRGQAKKDKLPYVCHGVIGAEILRKEGLAKHALICERHLWITKGDIIRQKLPLPKKDMAPRTIEEKAIYLADRFFTKHRAYGPKKEFSPKQVKEFISKFVKDKQVIKNKIQRFEQMLRFFGVEE